MYSISNQESSIKCIWKYVLFDIKPLLRGWKLLELKWGKTAFGEQTTKVNKWYRHHPRYSFTVPTVGHTKKAVIPTPGLFIERNYAVSFNNLCRKYREPDLHCINKKKTGIPTLFRKKNNNNNNNNRRYCFTQSSGLFPQTSSGRMVEDKKEQGF